MVHFGWSSFTVRFIFAIVLVFLTFTPAVIRTTTGWSEYCPISIHTSPWRVSRYLLAGLFTPAPPATIIKNINTVEIEPAISDLAFHRLINNLF